MAESAEQTNSGGSLLSRALRSTEPPSLAVEMGAVCGAVAQVRVLVINTGGTIGMVPQSEGVVEILIYRYTVQISGSQPVGPQMFLDCNSQKPLPAQGVAEASGSRSPRTSGELQVEIIMEGGILFVVHHQVAANVQGLG